MSESSIPWPVPQPQQYTTSAVDLYLGDEFFELKSIDELQQHEPAGMARYIQQKTVR